MDECCICLEELNNKIFTKYFKCCKKYIHSSCLLKLYSTQNEKCPLCRSVLLTIDNQFELSEIIIIHQLNSEKINNLILNKFVNSNLHITNYASNFTTTVDVAENTNNFTTTVDHLNECLILSLILSLVVFISFLSISINK